MKYFITSGLGLSRQMTASLLSIKSNICNKKPIGNNDNNSTVPTTEEATLGTANNKLFGEGERVLNHLYTRVNLAIDSVVIQKCHRV